MDAQGWAGTLAAFAAEERIDGRAVSTIATQQRRLAPLAAALGCDPVHARAGQIRDYLDALGERQLATATQKAERLAVRAFYRWAVATGRRASDPLEGYRHSTAPSLPEPWVHALADFAIDQRARSIAASTLAQRVKYLRRFAAQIARSPWAVSHSDVAGWLDSLDAERSTVLAHRSAMRAFYRWAAVTGRIHSDPMEYTFSGPRALPVPEPWAVPLIEWQSYLRAGARAETSIGTFLDVLRNFARQTHLSPFEVSTDDVAEWMGNKRWARETRRRNRQTLKSFYGWAVATGRMESNPVSALPIVKAAQPDARPAEEDEYKQALGRGDELERLALRLAAEAGMRRGEVARTHTRDLRGEPHARELTVRGKGGRVRRIPLTEGLAVQLLARPAGYVFPGDDDGHWSPRWLGRRVGRLLPPGVTMHQLRHRFATRAYELDRDLFGVQQLLGHASPATTRGYVQLTQQSLRRLVESVSV